MATANIQPVGPVQTEGLYSIPLETVVEAASQTFVKGTLLIYTNAGGGTYTYPEVQVAGANPASIAGVAMAKATGTTGTQLQMVPLLPNMIFEMSVDDALSGSNAPGTGTPSELTVGQTYGISIDGVSHNWYVDTSKSGANQRVRIIDFDADQLSVVNGRVRVRFLAANTYL